MITVSKIINESVFRAMPDVIDVPKEADYRFDGPEAALKFLSGKLYPHSDIGLKHMPHRLIPNSGNHVTTAEVFNIFDKENGEQFVSKIGKLFILWT